MSLILWRKKRSSCQATGKNHYLELDNDPNYFNLTGIPSYNINLTQIPKYRVLRKIIETFWRNNTVDYDIRQTMYLAAWEKILSA